MFRTFNASITLQTQLDELTDPDSTVPEKLLSYNRANRAVAILCNHQRAVPKQHDKSMENLKEKITMYEIEKNSFIYVEDNALPDNLCDQIISFFERSQMNCLHVVIFSRFVTNMTTVSTAARLRSRKHRLSPA